MARIVLTDVLVGGHPIEFDLADKKVKIGLVWHDGSAWRTLRDRIDKQMTRMGAMKKQSQLLMDLEPSEPFETDVHSLP